MHCRRYTTGLYARSVGQMGRLSASVVKEIKLEEKLQDVINYEVL